MKRLKSIMEKRGPGKLGESSRKKDPETVQFTVEKAENNYNEPEAKQKSL